MNNFFPLDTDFEYQHSEVITKILGITIINTTLNSTYILSFFCKYYLL